MALDQKCVFNGHIKMELQDAPTEGVWELATLCLQVNTLSRDTTETASCSTTKSKVKHCFCGYPFVNVSLIEWHV